MGLFTRRPSPSVVRPLRAELADDCAALHATSFAHPWSAAEFGQLLTSPTSLGSAALDPAKGALRGFALSRLVAGEAEILTVAVNPAWQRHGVGRDLLRAHLADVVRAGAATVFLEVDADNAAALALYARFGFVKVGERAGYYRRADGKTATALVMRRDLR